MAFRLVRNWFLTVIVMMLSACVTNVDFSDGRMSARPDLPSVKVYYDKQGDIYPSAWIETDDKLTKNSDHSLSCRYNKSLCGVTNSTIYSNAETKTIYQSWRGSQRAENSRVVDELVRELKNTKSQKVVMLIHGFRVPDAQADYDDAKEVLLNGRNANESPVFLEVHWDGRKTPTLPFSALKAWPQAQHTAPAVGFRLRSLLNELNERLSGNANNTSLFVLTHSTGAVVAGALFGNPTIALPCLENKEKADKCGANYVEFFEAIKSSREVDTVPQWNDMDVVMLAAATPASTFAIPNKRVLGFLGAENSNLLFSHSKDDSALNKYIRFPSLLGYSGLGARRNDLKIVEDTLGATSPKRANVVVLEMSKEMGKAHGLGQYVRTKEFSKALELLWKTEK